MDIMRGYPRYAAAGIGGACERFDVAVSHLIALTDAALLRPFGAWG